MQRRDVIDDDKKATVILEMAGIFGRALTSQMVERMLRSLWDIPSWNIEIAVEHLLRTAKSMPSVAEIVSAAELYGEPTNGRVIEMPVEQARATLDKIRAAEDSFYEGLNTQHDAERQLREDRMGRDSQGEDQTV